MWYRIGDTKEFFESRPIYNRIQYRPLQRSAIVRCLHIERTKQNKIIFLIETTGFGNQKFCDVGMIFYPETFFRSTKLGWMMVKLTYEDDLTKLIKFLKLLNTEEGYDLFSELLLTEFKNIYQYLITNFSYQPGFVHVISDTPPSFETVINPAKAGSKALVNFFNQTVRDVRELKRLLSKGESPNQNYEDGVLILHIALLGGQIELVEILLEYGSNPWLRGGDSYYSGLEFAYFCRKREYINLMLHFHTKVERNIPSVSILKCFFPNADETIFVLTDGLVVRTKYKMATMLSEREWNELFDLHKIYFEVPHDTSNQILEEKLKLDFSSKNTFVEFMYVDKKIIGYNLFQFVPPIDNKITVYYMYSIIHPNYRYTRLAHLLAFRPGHSLHRLFPDFTLTVFALVVSDDGLRLMASGDEYFPKFIPPGAKKFVKRLLAEIAPLMQYHHQDICNYVIDSVRPRQTLKTPQKTSFLQSHLVPALQPNSDMVYAATCYFVIGDKHFLALDNLAVRLNIKFNEFIISSTHQILQLIRQMELSNIPYQITLATTYYTNQKYLFWLNEKRIENKQPQIIGVETLDNTRPRARM